MSDISRLWRSERLVYRAVEDNDEDLAFLHMLQNEPTVLKSVAAHVLAPQRKDQTKEFMKQLVGKESLISVVACLESTDETATTSPSTTNTGAAAPTIIVPTTATATTTTTTSPISPKPAKPKLTPIGVAHLSAHEADSAHLRSTWLLIELAPEFQGRGYGTEALKWITNFGFNMIGLHRIGLCVFGSNKRALKFYERVGYVAEGRSRESLWFDGGWHDAYDYSMLEHEWRELRKQGKM